MKTEMTFIFKSFLSKSTIEKTIDILFKGSRMDHTLKSTPVTEITLLPDAMPMRNTYYLTVDISEIKKISDIDRLIKYIECIEVEERKGDNHE